MIINFFIRILDFIISFLNKLDDENNSGDRDSSKEIIFDSKEIFKINNFLKNESIFEELEKRYSYDSSSESSNPYDQSQNIFSSLNNVKDKDYTTLDESKDNISKEIKERLIGLLLNNRYLKINESNFYKEVSRIIFLIFSILTVIVALIAYFISLELGLAILITFILFAFAIFYYPKIRKQNECSSFSKELPYALRQLATELKSGKSLFDSMDSISRSDYGVLSFEFSRVLEEIKYGESTESAFLNLEKRVDSKALSRVIYEILTSLRVGVNLSSSLTIIADDVNFDIQMRLKEYGEKLNAFIMIYTFLAILAPVILLTLLLASSVVIGDLVPGNLVLVLYSVFFPMIIVFLGVTVKKLEPKI